jgi:hypothetical protein
MLYLGKLIPVVHRTHYLPLPLDKEIVDVRQTTKGTGKVVQKRAEYGLRGFVRAMKKTASMCGAGLCGERER